MEMVLGPKYDITKEAKMLFGPKYDGNHLHSLLRQRLGQLKLHDTLTNVIIPTFDIRILQPIIFSNFTVLNSVPFYVFLYVLTIALFCSLYI